MQRCQIRSVTNAMRTFFGALAISLAFCLTPTAGVADGSPVTVSQTITLRKGWNAFYVEVSPTVAATEVFSSWPVNFVGVYDPASFLLTRQFSSDWDSKGLSMNPVATWHRGYPELSSIETLPAGIVCLAFNTNSTSTAITVTGVPAAPRMAWHKTDSGEVYNFIGFSLQQGAEIAPADYMRGFDGAVTGGGFFEFAGSSSNKMPSVVSAYATRKVRDGDVLLVASDTQSRWAGPLFVSPMGGPEFGADGTRASLTIRNDGADARTVDVALLRPGDVGVAGPWGDISLPEEALKLRDAAVALTNAVWGAVSPETGSRRIASKQLDAGETWKLEFGLNRAALPAAEKGATFGALLRITDADGGSMMRVDVPITGAASGTDTAATAWPSGLWVADVALNQILPPGAVAETETGGEARIRLPIHLDAQGNLRLLQRVVAAGTTASDGTMTYHLYAGTAKVPSTATVAMRISAVTLPTETPVILAESGGTFSAGVSFPFTVAGDGATSLLRHPLHPQHDGLRWDFSTKAPSGDDFSNYKGDIKPETFSVSCRIALTLDLDGGEAAWNPENTKSGTCRWTFSNLMRQGDITLSGPMTIKRVSPLAEIVLE